MSDCLIMAERRWPIIGREAQVTEQLNNLRNTSLALEQNRLAHKRDLIEIDYQAARVTRLAVRALDRSVLVGHAKHGCLP